MATEPPCRGHVTLTVVAASAYSVTTMSCWSLHRYSRHAECGAQDGCVDSLRPKSPEKQRVLGPPGDDFSPYWK
jgi:hypothetical protein